MAQSGKTALHFAVDQEHEDVVELLLKANTDPDLQLDVSHVMQQFKKCFLYQHPVCQAKHCGVVCTCHGKVDFTDSKTVLQ